MEILVPTIHSKVKVHVAQNATNHTCASYQTWSK